MREFFPGVEFDTTHIGIFTKMLKHSGSAAQKTWGEVMAMPQWRNANISTTDWNDVSESEHMIAAETPGEDMANITRYVLTGLHKAAELLGVEFEQFVTEADLSPLKDLNPHQIFLVLDAIHGQWLTDNWKLPQLVEHYFHQRRMYRFRNTAQIGWPEVESYFVFIREYLLAANSEVNISAIRIAYNLHTVRFATDDIEADYVEFRNHLLCTADDMDLEKRKETVFREFVNGTIDTIKEFINACKSLNKLDLAEKASAFLTDHPTNSEALATILEAI